MPTPVPKTHPLVAVEPKAPQKRKRRKARVVEDSGEEEGRGGEEGGR